MRQVRITALWLSVVVALLAGGSLRGAPAAAGPVPGKPTPLFRVGISSEPPGLDIQWQTATITQDLMHHVYEFLFTMDRNLDFKPMFRASHALAPREWGFWYNDAGREFYNRPNLTRARALAAEAGYRGERIRWITTRDFDYMYRSALIASEQMKEAGFNVELIVMDWPTLISTRGKREAHEIFSTGIGFGGDPTATAAFTPDWPRWYDDPENNANYTALLITVDPAQRRKLFEEQQRLFWVKNPYLRFGDFFTFRATRKEVKGIFARGPAHYWNVWIEK
jgi:ABC-type transport system substrate-binding protein